MAYLIPLEADLNLFIALPLNVRAHRRARKMIDRGALLLARPREARG